MSRAGLEYIRIRGRGSNPDGSCYLPLRRVLHSKMTRQVASAVITSISTSRISLVVLPTSNCSNVLTNPDGAAMKKVLEAPTLFVKHISLRLVLTGCDSVCQIYDINTHVLGTRQNYC